MKHAFPLYILLAAAPLCAFAQGTAPVPQTSQFSLCTSETPFLPLSSADPDRPGRSQVLIKMAARQMGIEIRNDFAPWKRCQALVERGIYDAMNITGYAGINPTIAVFPMRDGVPDTSKSVGSVPSVLYRRVGSKADFVGGRIVNTDKPVAVLVTRQVNMDAVKRAGGTSEDGAQTVAALAQKLIAGQVDLAASAETDLAELVATQYKGVLEAIPTPLIESHYFVVFSKQYFANHRAEAEAFWSEIAKTRTRPEYLRAIDGIALKSKNGT